MRLPMLATVYHDLGQVQAALVRVLGAKLDARTRTQLVQVLWFCYVTLAAVCKYLLRGTSPQGLTAQTGVR